MVGRLSLLDWSHTVKLASFSLGQIITVGIMASVFILALKFAGNRFPNIPGISAAARAL
jgi:hypothetical protein